MRQLTEVMQLILESKKTGYPILLSGTEFIFFYKWLVFKELKNFEVSYCCLNDKLKNEEFILCMF